MHLASNEFEALAELGQKITQISHSLTEDFTPEGEPITLAGSDDLFAGTSPTQLLQITSGQVHYRISGKLTLIYGPGDILGLSRMLSLPDGTYSSTDALTLQPLERDTFIAHVCRDEKRQKLWSYFLISQTSWLQQALAQEMRQEYQPHAGFLRFAPGETIIAEGDEADLVYTLLEGRAHAVCNGVVVGEIHSDEIFGALAVFTGQKRIASVVANTDCTVLTVHKEEFIELVEHQPHICIGLIEEMAQKIKQLNEQLASHEA